MGAREQRTRAARSASRRRPDRGAERPEHGRSAPMPGWPRSPAPTRRRADAERSDAASVERLAAQIRGLFDFVDARPPGELAVRALQPGPRAGRVAGRRHGGRGQPRGRAVPDRHRQRGAPPPRPAGARGRAPGDRASSATATGRVTAITAARGALHRESVMHFEVDRRLGDTPAGGARRRHPAGAGRSAPGGARLPHDGRPDRPHDRVRAGRRLAVRPRRDRRDGRLPAVAGRRQLRVPGLPRVPDRGRTRGEQVVRVAPGSGLGILSEEAGSGFAQPGAGGRTRPGPSRAGARRPAAGDHQDQPRGNRPPPGPDGLHRGQAGAARTAP